MSEAEMFEMLFNSELKNHFNLTGRFTTYEDTITHHVYAEGNKNLHISAIDDQYLVIDYQDDSKYKFNDITSLVEWAIGINYSRAFSLYYLPDGGIRVNDIHALDDTEYHGMHFKMVDDFCSYLYSANLSLVKSYWLAEDFAIWVCRRK
jgi:hypothetical protein